jgi:hypothetical protein
MSASVCSRKTPEQIKTISLMPGAMEPGAMEPGQSKL